MTRLLVITGPTATGKSGLGIALAKRLRGEVISADSMQLYKGMTIGTAAVTPEEAQGVKHHMVGCISPCCEYSAAQYSKDAKAIIADISSRGCLPLVVGGTWLYIEALLNKYNFAQTQKDEALRSELKQYALINGAQALHDMLAQTDAQAAQRLHPNDVKRVIRALEIAKTGGLRQQNEPEPEYDALKIALVCSNREELYSRIDARVDIMVKNGLLDEVKRLKDSGADENGQAFKAIGYRQLLPVLRGEGSIDAAIEDIKRESRRYAKRQLTFLRAHSEIHQIDILNKTKQQIEREALDIIKEKTTWIATI